MYIPAPSSTSLIYLSLSIFLTLPPLSLYRATPHELLNILPLICQIFELHEKQTLAQSAALPSTVTLTLTYPLRLPCIVCLATTRTELNVWLCHAAPQKANKLPKVQLQLGQAAFLGLDKQQKQQRQQQQLMKLGLVQAWPKET